MSASPALAFLLIVFSATSAVAGKAARLCRAAEEGDFDTVQELLQKRVKPDRACGYERSALVRALFADENSLEMTHALLQHGADPNHTNRHGLTALILLPADPSADVAEKIKLLLLHGADVDAMGNGLTALIMASRFHKAELIRLLLVNGAHPNKRGVAAENALGWAPLHFAADRLPVPIPEDEHAAAESVRALVDGGAFVDIQDLGGFTPLVIAASEGRLDVVQLLVESGADAGLTSRSGDSAMSIASENDHDEIVEYLLSLNVADSKVN